MKYDFLEPFKEYLYQNLTKNTAKTYYAAIVKLLADIQFSDIRQITAEWMLEEAGRKFHTKAEFSAAKNGIKWLGKFYPDLRIPAEEEFRAVSVHKRNFSKKPKKTIYLNPTRRKINQIRDKKLKYAYRLALVSGLRVSELADLEAGDFSFESGKIYVRVRHGKGGHGGVVECREDPYLYERLPPFLEQSNGKVFYSDSYMKEKAGQLGMECHDLRRIFAIETRNELKREMPVSAANDIVQERMRHSRFSTTKRYLFNRKLKFEYEDEEKKEVTKEEKINQQQTSEGGLSEKDIVSVTQIDKERYRQISENILSDEVVLTPKCKEHIIARRGKEFFDKYSPHFKEIIDNPDFIFKDSKLATALVARKFVEDGKYINIVLRLVVQGDNPEYKNSIITAIGENEKRFEQRLRNSEYIYKKE